MRKSILNPLDCYGRLTLLQRFVMPVGKKQDSRWYCICECGNTKVIRGCSITSGYTISCGCAAKDATKLNIIKATNAWRKYSKEDRESKIFKRWKTIIDRVKNLSPKSKNFKIYKGKGITVCKEWEVFENFKAWSLKNGFRPELTIDRIDGSKGYSPDNCRYVTMAENLKNRDLSYMKGPRPNMIGNQNARKNKNFLKDLSDPTET